MFFRNLLKRATPETFRCMHAGETGTRDGQSEVSKPGERDPNTKSCTMGQRAPGRPGTDKTLERRGESRYKAPGGA